MGVTTEETALLPPLSAVGTSPKPKAGDGAGVTDTFAAVSAIDECGTKQAVDPDTLASDGKTFVNAVVSFLGTGVLGFSSAFMKTGVLLGLALLIVVGALSAFCMLLLVDCKYQLQRRGITAASYGDIGRHALGASGQRLVEVALVLAQTGFGVGFLIFVATNVHSYFGVARAVVIACSVPVLAAFALIKHVSQLAYVALTASVMNLCGLAIVYVTDLSFMTSNDESSLLELNWLGTLSYAPFFFGVATYCFSGIGMVLPLENSMRHKRHFRGILTSVVLLVGLIYASFGVCGYLAFGEHTQDVLLLNLRGQTLLASAVDLLFCASVFFGYPIMLFPVFDAVQHRVVPETHNARSDCGKETRIAVFRASIVAVTAVIAAAVPNFAPFISFVGSTCCSLLGFVLPVVFYLRLVSSAPPASSALSPLPSLVPEPTPLSVTRRRLLVGVMVLGVLALVAGVANAADNLF